MDSPSKLLNKSFALGVVVGGMLAGIAGLAAFLYIDGPGLIGTSFASGRGEPRSAGACERLAELGDRDALIAFGHFANRTSTSGEVVMMGRKTDAEICERAVDILSKNLTRTQLTAVTTCVATSATGADVRRCWTE